MNYVNGIYYEFVKFDSIMTVGLAREAYLEIHINYRRVDGSFAFYNLECERYRKAITSFQRKFEITWTRSSTNGLPYSTKSVTPLS